MIIASETPLEIGKRAGETGELSDYNGNYHQQMPFLVLRMATRQEWIDHALANGARLMDVMRLATERDLFYEISVD